MNWISKHATLFGNRTVDWEDTYAAWHEMFSTEGFTNAQLEAAVLAVAKRFKVPVFAAEHLNALREELRDIAIRNREAALKAAKAREPRCPHCKNMGTVWVPIGLNAQTIGQWSHQGCQCACDYCDIAKLEGFNDPALSTYEARFPEWRDHLQKARALRIERVNAEGPPSQGYQAAKARLVAHASLALEKGVNQ